MLDFWKKYKPNKFLKFASRINYKKNLRKEKC